MATALKLRSDIKKLKKAIETKGISAPIKQKLKSQLEKAENELATLKSTGKAPKKSSVAGTKTALTSLQKLVNRKKFSVYKGKGVDLKKDAGEGAMATGRRVSKGLKSNQYGSKASNKGNVYYEYRPNRLDVKQPKGRQKYPKLERGGVLEEAKMKADNSNWTNEKLKNEYDDYIQMQKDFDAGKIKPSKVIGGGYKSSAIAKKLAKKWIDNNIEIYKKALEIRGVMADGGIMAKGGKLSLSEFFEKYEENEDNNKHSENVVLLAENFGTKDEIRDAKTILAKHEAIGSLPSYLMQERDALSKKLYNKYLDAKAKSEGSKMASGGYMADGGYVVINKGGDRYDGGLFYQIKKGDEVVKQGLIDGDSMIEFEGKKYDGLKSLAEGINAELKIEKMKYGGQMAEGGEIKKGDYVIVDNPVWKAALGNDKPVRRKVKMVIDTDVVFHDGSISQLKYVKKMEDGGVISNTHKID